MMDTCSADCSSSHCDSYFEESGLLHDLITMGEK